MVGITPLPDLPVLRDPIESIYVDEKKQVDSVEDVTKKTDSLYGKDSSLEDLASSDSGVLYVNGEPVIRTGEDVSNFLIDVRDDGDPALTFRSLALGTVFAGLGAALCQVSPNILDTPVNVALSVAADIFVQASPSQRLHSLLTSADLLRRQRLGCASSTFAYRARDPLGVVRTMSRLH